MLTLLKKMDAYLDDRIGMGLGLLLAIIGSYAVVNFAPIAILYAIAGDEGVAAYSPPTSTALGISGNGQVGYSPAPGIVLTPKGIQPGVSF